MIMNSNVGIVQNIIFQQIHTKNDSPILLVPKSFLNVLPQINPYDFVDTIDLAERLRNDLNYEINKNLNKEKIAQIAIEKYNLVKEYIDIVEKRTPNSFD